MTICIIVYLQLVWPMGKKLLVSLVVCDLIDLKGSLVGNRSNKVTGRMCGVSCDCADSPEAADSCYVLQGGQRAAHDLWVVLITLCTACTKLWR